MQSEMSNERRQMNELEEKIAELERTNARLVVRNNNKGQRYGISLLRHCDLENLVKVTKI